MDQARAQARGGVVAPHQFLDAGDLVAGLRLIKDEAELDTMTRAASISAAAHVRAMQTTRPGMAEYEIEAGLLADFRRKGAQSVAYGSIVASGPHSCILHHRAGDRRMRAGEMLLIDAGCELDGYASDITRTFPVSGRFTAAQRDCYALVLAAQAAAVEATRPGAAFTDPHEAAVKVLAQGMIDLHLLPAQSTDAAIESGAYRRFYMHRTGHWLGLDVHDVGDYRQPLAPGMVLTIEPGLYIQPAEDIAEDFWNVGIRIEDDAVVSATGCELITRGVPVAIDAIEDLMTQHAS
jgi:Xaa-Pro aminopeptidase